jgi:hypothetical protein
MASSNLLLLGLSVLASFLAASFIVASASLFSTISLRVGIQIFWCLLSLDCLNTEVPNWTTGRKVMKETQAFAAEEFGN